MWAPSCASWTSTTDPPRPPTGMPVGPLPGDPPASVCPEEVTPGLSGHSGVTRGGSAAWGTVVEHEVEQDAVAPVAVEVQERGDPAALLEPAAPQDRLRRQVRHHRAGAEPVQAEVVTALHEELQRRDREAAAEVCVID